MGAKKETTRQDIARRILSLRKVAADAGATEAERNTARRLEAKLTDQWGITEDDLRSETDPSIYAVDLKPPSCVPWVYQLGAMLALHHSCGMVRRTLEGQPAWLEVLTGFQPEELANLQFVAQILFIGEDSDAKLCAQQYEDILSAMQRDAGRVLWEDLRRDPLLVKRRSYASWNFSSTSTTTSSPFGRPMMQEWMEPVEPPPLDSRDWIELEQSWAMGAVQALWLRLEASRKQDNEPDDSFMSDERPSTALATNDDLIRLAKRKRAEEFIQSTLLPAMSGKGDAGDANDESADVGDSADSPPAAEAAGPEAQQPPPLGSRLVQEMFQRGVLYGHRLKIGDYAW